MKPEAGQWWVAERAKAGDTAQAIAVRIEHILPNGDIVVETYPGTFAVWKDNDFKKWHHEPRCTGWDWAVPEHPQPAEDPDEWVIQDRVPVRPKDEYRFSDAVQWTLAGIERAHGSLCGLKHGDADYDGYIIQVRCRRRDLPKVEQKTLVELCADKTPTADISILGGPHDVCVMPTAEDLPKVEQAEQWPKYWTKLDPTDSKVAYVKQVSKSSGIIVYATGHESDEFPWCKDDNSRQELTEAEAMALLKQPEPQPQKTRVRLWKCHTKSQVVASIFDLSESGHWQEIHHDAEGFFVEG